jgi:hypothetical protein
VIKAASLVVQLINSFKTFWTEILLSINSPETDSTNSNRITEFYRYFITKTIVIFSLLVYLRAILLFED